MTGKNHLNRIVYTDGSNGIVRLEPRIWRAFYEAALYLDLDSVQQAFTMFIEFNGCFTKELDFVTVVDLLQGEAPKTTGLYARSCFDAQCVHQYYDTEEQMRQRNSLRRWLTNYDNTLLQTNSVSAAANAHSEEMIHELSNQLKEWDLDHDDIPF